MKSKKKIVIAVMSNASAAQRREFCRQMWVNDALKEDDISIFFAVGKVSGSRRKEAGVVTLDCEDDSASVCDKKFAMLTYALKTYEFEHLFFCDDDTYVQPARLANYPRYNKMYIGYDYGRFMGRDSYAHGGAGFFVSCEAAEIALGLQRSKGMPADLSIGQCLKKNNVDLHHDERFVLNWEIHRMPRPENDFVTAHYVNSSERAQYIMDIWVGKPLHAAKDLRKKLPGKS